MKNELTGCDYQTVKVKRIIEKNAAAAYESLGWELDGSVLIGLDVTLRFKRKRKIENKRELNEIQSSVTDSVKKIEKLQQKRNTTGLIPALTAGLAGLLAFGGGMSLLLLRDTVDFLFGVGVAVGLVGMGICSVTWILNKKIRDKNLPAIDTAIDLELNNLAALCERAKALTGGGANR